MAVNNQITRGMAEAIIPEDEFKEIVQGAVKSSKVMQLFTRLADMTTKQAKMPVLNGLPEAYFVTGDDGLKQTTSLMWKNKFITAEEIAVIVPIPEAVLEDSNYDIWGEIRPRIAEAIGKKFDEAVLLGKGKPQSWREGLIPSIINAGADITPGVGDTLYKQISDAMGAVEEDGFDVTGIMGGVGLKKVFREGFLATDGNTLNANEVTELPRVFVDNGAWDSTLAKLVVGDFRQAVYSIRKDITYKLLDQSVITNADGVVVLNLAQQDCVALRVVFRAGWEIPNPINALNSSEETRFPFALVNPASPATTYDVEFTVTDTSSSPVAGATVTMGGITKTTNASGVATFESLGNTSYLYKVTKAGANDRYGTATVATSDVDVAIENF